MEARQLRLCVRSRLSRLSIAVEASYTLSALSAVPKRVMMVRNQLCGSLGWCEVLKASPFWGAAATWTGGELSLLARLRSREALETTRALGSLFLVPLSKERGPPPPALGGGWFCEGPVSRVERRTASLLRRWRRLGGGAPGWAKKDCWGVNKPPVAEEEEDEVTEGGTAAWDRGLKKEESEVEDSRDRLKLDGRGLGGIPGGKLDECLIEGLRALGRPPKY